MPKQVGSQTSKRLLRLATFGSFSNLYHIPLVVVSHEMFWRLFSVA